MKLHEHMERAVADTTADLTRLTGDSRKQGLRLRRQRRALSGVGVAAALAVVVSAGSLLPGGPDPDRGVGPAGNTAVEPAPSTVPFTGRALVAALRAGIDEVAVGTYGDLGGQEGIDAYGQLEFTPADGLGAGVVGLRVSHPDMIVDWPLECRPRMVDCTVRTLPNGDQVLSALSPAESDGIYAGATLIPENRSMIVTVSASNGFEGQGGVWDVTRPDPVLNLAQLRHIVAQPEWGFEMPRQFQEAGDDLADYVDFDTDPGWTFGSD